MGEKGFPGKPGENSVGRQGGKGGEGGAGGAGGLGDPKGSGGSGGGGGEGGRGATGDTGPINPLSKWLKIGLITWIVVFSILVSWAIRSNRQLAQQGRQARDAICVLRIDLQSRIKTSEERIANSITFLDKHPNGAFGLSKDEIQATIDSDLRAVDGQRMTLKSLSIVKCKTKES